MKRFGCCMALIMMAFMPVFASGARDSGTKEIKFWTFIEPGGAAGRSHTLQTIIDRFERDNPGTKVVVEVQPWTELSGKFMAAWAAGNAPDVSIIHSTAVESTISLGSLELLDPYIAKWPSQEKSDFANQNLWNEGSKNGNKYLFAIMPLAEVLACRRDLLAAGNLKPENIKDWQDFISAAKLLSVDGAGKHPGEAGFNPATVKTWGYGRWLARNTGAFVMVDAFMKTIDGSRALKPDNTANWTTPTGVRAFTLFVDLMKQGLESPRDLTADLSTSDAYFTSGSEVFHHLASFRAEAVKEKVTFNPGDFAMISYPGVDNKPHSVELNAWYAGVSSKSRNKELAWKFLQTMVDAEADLQWAKDTTGLLPLRKSTMNSAWFKSEAAALTRSVSDAAAQNSHLALLPPVDYKEYLIIAFHEVLQNTDILTALKRAEEDYNKRLKETK
ncbi:MAG: extracellular solute-binding protein [Treponema sp.]|jgi:multiple sugar transport system substrate-binding protein|nr:extracellular solute-binding protein [Treponema sp.]